MISPIQPHGRASLVFNVAAFGAVGDGVADDSAAIQAAHNFVNSSGYGIVSFDPGKTYKCNSVLSWICGRVGIKGNGAKLDFTSLTSGTAITFDAPASVPYSLYAPLLPIEDFAVLLTKSESNNADGVRFGRYASASGEVSHWNINNLQIYGGRDGAVFGNQTWCLVFLNLKVQDQWRSSTAFDTTTNAGENISFHGGALTNCKHTALTGANVRVRSGAPGLNFFGTSFDYSDYAAIVNGGALNLIGCHLENNSTNPFIVIAPAVGQVPNVMISGGSVVPTEAGSGRTTLFQQDTATGQNQRFRMGGTQVKVYGRTSEIVTWTNPALPPAQCDLSGTALDTQSGGTTMPTIGASLNCVFNGDFEFNVGAAPSGWTNSSLGTYTLTSTASVGRSGNAAVVTNAGSGNMNFNQQIAIRPGQEVIFSAWVNIPTYTAGTVYFRLRFFDRSGAQLVQNKDHQSWSAATAGWVRTAGRYIAPAGAAFAVVDMYHLGLNGTVRWDDVQAWVI